MYSFYLQQANKQTTDRSLDSIFHVAVRLQTEKHYVSHITIFHDLPKAQGQIS